MKRFLVLIMTLMLCGGCQGIKHTEPVESIDPVESSDKTDSVTFRALVVSKEDTGLSVIVMDDGISLRRFDPVHVSFDTTGLDAAMGDIVEINFNGLVAESYPSQIGAYTVKVKEKVSGNWPATGSIPPVYTEEEAVEDRCFVIALNQVRSKELLDSFVSNTQAGIMGFLRKVSYTDEGDPIITDVIYDGKKYHVFEDDTRDKYGDSGTGIYQKEYIYINTFEKSGYKLLYLAEKKDITPEEYEKSLYSGNSKDQIDTYPLYQETAKAD